VLELHKVLERHKVLVQHKVRELHRSKQLELHHRCKPSCERASEPTNLLASQQVHIRCHKQVLARVLVHKPQGHCKKPCESAGG